MTDATDLQYSIPPQKPLKVLIVGCGISGLTTALGLKLSGHGVTIFEQTSTLAEVGAGIQLAPSASRILRRLGVLVEVTRKSNILEQNSLRRYQDNQELGKAFLMPQAEEKYYAPLAVIHRGDLLDILVRKVKGLGVSIRLNARVEAINPEFEARIQIHPKDNPITSDLIQQNIGMRWMGPGGHIMAYPIKRNTFYNMVLVHPQTVSGERKDEAWTRVGSEHQMQHIYQGWNEVIQMLLFLVPEQEIVKRSLHLSVRALSGTRLRALHLELAHRARSQVFCLLSEQLRHSIQHEQLYPIQTALWDELMSHWVQGSTKDLSARSQAAAAASSVVLLDLVSSHCGKDIATRLDLARIIIPFKEKASNILYQNYTATREEFLCVPATADHLCGASSRFYRLVRRTLAVPMNRGLADHPTYDSEKDPRATKAIGSHISTIYTELRQGGMTDAVVNCWESL
ncbi:hypothetical protein ETB97_011428 [Aspergillus alliaceus]|uniref:FAD-binding domain-containing protein n=1 Tax=Petromyces alliaceus TaxID=209559 RepID=A0A8H6ABU5_PETAA|nr:hypothetical protein ETB97_011428 [Aspergillus burnettii]